MTLTSHVVCKNIGWVRLTSRVSRGLPNLAFEFIWHFDSFAILLTLMN